jgi:hypothetical protein
MAGRVRRKNPRKMVGISTEIEKRQASGRRPLERTAVAETVHTADGTFLRKKKPSPVAHIISSKQRRLMVLMSTSPIGRTIPTHVAAVVSTGALPTTAAAIQRGVNPVTVTSTGATASSSGQEDLLLVASDTTEMCRSESSLAAPALPHGGSRLYPMLSFG